MELELLDILTEPVEGHTDFQLDHFVTGSEAYNAWGGYRQAKRELIARLKAYHGLIEQRDDQEGLAAFMLTKAIDRTQDEARRCLAHVKHYGELVEADGRPPEAQEREYWFRRIFWPAATTAIVGGHVGAIVELIAKPGIRSAFSAEIAPIKAAGSAEAFARGVFQAMRAAEPIQAITSDPATIEDFQNAYRLASSAGQLDSAADALPSALLDAHAV